MFFDYGTTDLHFEQQGRLKTHTERVGNNGLKGALEGLQEMQAGKVRGEKLVYQIVETP